MGYEGIRRYQKCWQRSLAHYTTLLGMILISIKMVENSVHNMIEENTNEDVIEGLININDINNAIKQIKSNKSDGYLGLYSDHFINGTDKMYELLVKLYNGMLTHGCSPQNILVGTLFPIPKNKRVNINISDNFRAVCLQVFYVS